MNLWKILELWLSILSLALSACEAQTIGVIRNEAFPNEVIEVRNGSTIPPGIWYVDKPITFRDKTGFGLFGSGRGKWLDENKYRKLNGRTTWLRPGKSDTQIIIDTSWGEIERLGLFGGGVEVMKTGAFGTGKVTFRDYTSFWAPIRIRGEQNCDNWNFDGKTHVRGDFLDVDNLQAMGFVVEDIWLSGKETQNEEELSVFFRFVAGGDCDIQKAKILNQGVLYDFRDSTRDGVGRNNAEFSAKVKCDAGADGTILVYGGESFATVTLEARLPARWLTTKNQDGSEGPPPPRKLLVYDGPDTYRIVGGRNWPQYSVWVDGNGGYLSMRNVTNMPDLIQDLFNPNCPGGRIYVVREDCVNDWGKPLDDFRGWLRI